MLQCAANFQGAYGGKVCAECGLTDNENHRMNECSKWQGVNMYGKQNDIEFDRIYSENYEECGAIVNNILKIWDLENGKNTMRLAQQGQ